ncbi:uncharacterized protein LOC143230167 [Tachypleus tridentatus]|uniref:uncharacterized protein LOC143230167 n=1 Tax=Tachypleus tridentatus TaxID=6853 RepID=UPI003FD2DF0E
MPGTYRYSATYDKTYLDSSSLGSSTSRGTTNSTKLSVMSSNGDAVNGSYGRHSRADSYESLDSNGGSSASHSRQLSLDSTGSVGLKRTLSKGATVPTVNPLQFVKINPCSLSQKAKEQMKLAKETKVIKTKLKEHDDEWQDNLDSWKSRRKKASKDIIERMEEMRQIELEEKLNYEPKKTKTFSKMMEERSEKRKPFNLSIYSAQDEGQFDSNEERHTSSECGSNNESNTEEECWKKEVFLQMHGEVNETNGTMNQTFQQETLISPDKYKTLDKECEHVSYHTDSGLLSSCTENSESRGANFTRDSRQNSCERLDSASDFSFDSSSGVEKTLTEDECGNEELTVGMEMLEEFSSSKYQKGSSKDSFYNQFKADGVELCLRLWLRKGTDVKNFGFSIMKDECFNNIVTVQSVMAGSPSDFAGLRVGDKIWAIDGEKAAGRAHSERVIKQAVYRRSVELVVWRPYQSTFEGEGGKKYTGDNGLEIGTSNMEGLQTETALSQTSQSSNQFPSSTSKASTLTNIPRIESFSEIQRKTKKPPPVPEKPKCLPTETIIQKMPVERETTAGTWKDEATNVLSCGPLEETSADSSSDNEMFVDDFEQLKAEVEAASSPKEDSLTKHESTDHLKETENISPEIMTSTSSDAAPVEDNLKSERVKEVIDNEPMPDYTQISDSTICDDQLHKGVFITPNLECDVPLDTSLEQKKLETESSLPQEINQPAYCHSELETDLQADLSEGEINSNYQQTVTEMLHSDVQSVTSKDLDAKERSDTQPDLLSPEDVIEEMEKIILDQLEQEEQEHVSKETADFDQPGYPVDTEEFDSILLAEIDMAPCSMEPPKEKPPPPPIESELSDDEDVKEEPSIKLRGDTSKNVKKELLKRRSDFLGINLPGDDESEPDEQVIQPPPAIEELLVSERELQRQQRLQLQTDLRLNSQESEQTENLLSLQRSKSQTELDTRNQPQYQRQHSYPGDQCLEEDDEEIARKEREIIENLEREERNQHEIEKDEQELSIADQPGCVMEEDERIQRLQEERRRMSEERMRMEEQRMRMEEESQFSDRQRGAMFEDDSKAVNPTGNPVFQPEHSYQFVQYQCKGNVRTTVPTNVSTDAAYQKIWTQRDSGEPSVRDSYKSHSPTEENVWARGEMIRASRKPQGLDQQPFVETLNVNEQETITAQEKTEVSAPDPSQAQFRSKASLQDLGVPPRAKIIQNEQSWIKNKVMKRRSDPH